MAYRAQPQHGIAWITGASTGIGRALALELVADGWTVAITARSADKLDSLKAEIAAKGGKAIVAPCDVTDAAAMAELIAGVEAAHRPIALAVFNAGSYWPSDGKALDIDNFRKTYEINYFGVINGLVPIAARFKARGRGHVVLVGSVSGYMGLPLAAAYGSSKAALINLAESLAHDFAALNIGIQLVSPGFIDTPATEQNEFTMPALMPVGKAARRMADGLKTQAFEITFPRRFTWVLKVLKRLPYRVRHWAIGRTTGAGQPAAEAPPVATQV
jgi:NAD(P)-dependent dehydrogenase (short-subunit alcohol dehydrogenase family)